MTFNSFLNFIGTMTITLFILGTLYALVHLLVEIEKLKLRVSELEDYEDDSEVE